MKKLLTLVLAVPLLVAFAGHSAAQQKPEKKVQPAEKKKVEPAASNKAAIEAAKAEEAEMLALAECISDAVNKARAKREELIRQGKNPDTELGDRSYHRRWWSKR